MSSNIEIERVCEYCKQLFKAKTTATRYCSHQCNSRGYKANVKGLKIKLSNIETKNTTTSAIDFINAKEYLSIRDARVLIGISTRSLYRLIKNKQLHIDKIGTRTIIQRREINKLFKIH